MQNHRSIWQRLKNREINCDEALKILVDEQGVVNLDLLDPEVSQRFLREFPIVRRQKRLLGQL